MEPDGRKSPAETDLVRMLPGWSSRIAALERRLGGEDRRQPFPAGWQEPAAGVVARIGVAAADLAKGGYVRAQQDRAASGVRAGLSHRADEKFPAASTLKVFVLQALLEAVAAGRRRLDERLVLQRDDAVTGSGVLKMLSAGTALSLLDLATLMIAVSDNTATNMLIDLLGLEAIMASVRANGWTDTHLRGKLQQAPVVAAGNSSYTATSPRDLADYFSRLWAGELLPAELTAISQRIYRRQQFTELGRRLDYDSYSAEIGVSDMLVASKSGSIRGVRNDAGVIELSNANGAGDGGDGAGDSGDKRSLVVAIMTDGCPDRRFHADNLGAVVVGEVAATVLAELRG